MNAAINPSGRHLPQWIASGRTRDTMRLTWSVARAYCRAPRRFQMPQLEKDSGTRTIGIVVLRSKISAPGVAPATTWTLTPSSRRYSSHNHRPLPPLRGGNMSVSRRSRTSAAGERSAAIALERDFQPRQEVGFPGAGMPRPRRQAAAVHVECFQPAPGLPEADVAEMPEVLTSEALQKRAAFAWAQRELAQELFDPDGQLAVDINVFRERRGRRRRRRVVGVNLIDDVRLEKVRETRASRQDPHDEQLVFNDAESIVEAPSIEQLPLHHRVLETAVEAVEDLALEDGRVGDDVQPLAHLSLQSHERARLSAQIRRVRVELGASRAIDLPARSVHPVNVRMG